MNTVTAQERVEILDNGSHVGWAEVVDGKWSCQLQALGVGSHRLTASSKGVISASRVLNIQEAVERFDDMPIGRLQNGTTVTRAFYKLSPQYSISDTVSIEDAGSGWLGELKCLQLLSLARSESFVIVTLYLDRPCSQVSLDCNFVVIHNNGYAGFALLRGHRTNGKWVDHHLHVSTNPGGFTGTINVKSPEGQKDIAKVELGLYSSSGYPVYSDLRWSIDNLRLTF